MDKTGLFFRLLPKYTLLMPFEVISSTQGKKKAKERVSLVACANTIGMHNMSCILIGKPKFPACIKNQKWPVRYISQNKAWMDVFSHLLEMVRRSVSSRSKKENRTPCSSFDGQCF